MKIKKIVKDVTLWARQCEISGEGMNEGYFFDDTMYIANDKDLINTLRSKDYTPEDEDGNQLQAHDMTDQELMEWAYNEEIYYWTEWFDDEDVQYAEIDGVMYEESTDEFKEVIKQL